MTRFVPLINVGLALALAPLLQGVINRIKAKFAGRIGPPLLQPYHDLLKLLRKGAVYSRTTTWLFRAGPMVGLAAVLASLLLMPLGGSRAPLAFSGDLVLFVGLMALMRFATVLAALDTGSSFEGMGASREIQFAMLAEPALLIGLAALARQAHALSLTEIAARISPHAWGGNGPSLALIAVALLVVLLAENARMPVDDPQTHLELTMIHEVMVLDHGGPDLAFVLYGAALKFWVFAALVAGILMPVRTGRPAVDVLLATAAIFLLAVAVGVVESVLARLRLVRVPHLLAGASAFSIVALVFVLH